MHACLLFSISHHRKNRTDLLIPLWYLLTSFWNRNKVKNNTVVSDSNDTTILTITCAQTSHLPTYLRLSIIQFYNNIIFILTLILKNTGMVIEICFQPIITYIGRFLNILFINKSIKNDIHFFFLAQGLWIHWGSCCAWWWGPLRMCQRTWREPSKPLQSPGRLDSLLSLRQGQDGSWASTRGSCPDYLSGARLPSAGQDDGPFGICFTLKSWFYNLHIILTFCTPNIG